MWHVECSGGRGSVLKTKSSNPQTTSFCIFRLGYLLLGGAPGLCTGIDPVDISVLPRVPKNGLS